MKAASNIFLETLQFILEITKDVTSGATNGMTPPTTRNRVVRDEIAMRTHETTPVKTATPSAVRLSPCWISGFILIIAERSADLPLPAGADVDQGVRVHTTVNRLQHNGFYWLDDATCSLLFGFIAIRIPLSSKTEMLSPENIPY